MTSPLVKMKNIFLVFFSIFISKALGQRGGRATGGRIVGGVEIDIENIPYQCSLRFYESHICGASIISSKFVITAAHCTYYFPQDDMSLWSIRAGTSRSDEGGSIHEILEIFQHPRFNPSLLDFDASIFKLDNAIQIDKFRQPIELPFFGELTYEGSLVSTSGWGLTMNRNESNLVLRNVELKTSNRLQCHKAYISDGGITTRMICAYGDGRDSCSGGKHFSKIFYTLN